MARLVTKFKYLKYAGRYAKYISTREGVEKLDDSKKFLPATEKQKTLVQKILRDFPDSKRSLEYEDYLRAQTQGAASEFIARSLEENAAELLHRSAYADYIALRPRAQRFGAHGLFTDDGVAVQLSKVEAELNAHKGNVYTAIISLRREDAQRLGFDSGERWRDFLRGQTQALSEGLKIPLQHLRWYAAFHDEGNHPHVHLIAYGADPREGYLSKQGVNRLRSSLARDIFAQELLCIYEEQTQRRDGLKQAAAELVQSDENPKIEALLTSLASRLQKVKGKKQYAYLPAREKRLVDDIVDALSKDARIAALYDSWCQSREKILHIYNESTQEYRPLSENETFRSIKNQIIQEALRREDFSTNGSALRLLTQLAQMIQNDAAFQSENAYRTDRKLRRKLQEKKQSQGLKMEESLNVYSFHGGAKTGSAGD